MPSPFPARPAAQVARPILTRRMPRSLRFALWRGRWVVAALAIVLGAKTIAPLWHQPTGEPVVVLAVDVDAGHRLTEADLALARLPPESIPAGSASEVASISGKVMAVAGPRTMVVIPSLLAGSGLAERAPEGTVVTGIRLDDRALAATLRPGDRIDVLAAGGQDGSLQPATVVASRALVLASINPNSAGASGDEQLVFAAVTPQEASLLSGAGSWVQLSAVLVR